MVSDGSLARRLLENIGQNLDFEKETKTQIAKITADLHSRKLSDIKGGGLYLGRYDLRKESEKLVRII